MLVATITMTIFGVLLVMVGASLVAFLLAKRLRDPNQRAHGTGAKLCRKLNLSLNDRGMLRSLAQHTELPGLIPLIISRGCFDHAVSTYNPRGADAHQLSAIRKKIFSVGTTTKK